MELTVKIDMANTSATLVERHSLVAGDNYNPLNFDLSSLTAAQIAAVDLSTLTVSVKKTAASVTTLASSNVFSNGTQTSSGGTATVLPKIKKTTLLLNTQAIKDWFDTEAASSSPNFQQTVYFELSDTNVTYAACTMPFILRTFTVGSSTTGYYTKDEVDALLAAKQGTVTATSPLSKSAQNALSVGLASTSDFGVVKIGDRLIVTNGVLSATDQTPTTDSALDDDSTNAVQNKPVAEAFEGVTTRLDSLLKTTDGVETGRVKNLESQMSGKVATNSLSTVAFSGSYEDLSDKPDIPDSAVSALWHQESISGTTVSLSGTGYSAGDMILNGTTGDVYRVSSSEGSFVATKVGNIRGPQGQPGVPGRLVKTYSSVTEMQNSFSSDTSVSSGEMVMIDTGSPSDPDTGKLYRKGSSSFEYIADLSGQRGNFVYCGTYLTYSNSAVSKSNSPDFTYAYPGDKYINVSTGGGLFNCTSGGNPTDSAWEYVGPVVGADGEDGDDGDNGEDGATWLSGTSVYTSGSSVVSTYTGSVKVGDMYLNSTERKVYSCTASDPQAWSLVCSFGQNGQDGQNGSTWIVGTSITHSGEAGSETVDYSGFSGQASVGDFYMNSSTMSVYRKTSDSWQYVSTLKGTPGTPGSPGSPGTPGAAGTPGTKWITGTAVSGTNTVSAASSYTGSASAGDIYLNTTEKRVYSCRTSSSTGSTPPVYAVWSYLFDLGHDGIDGADGNSWITGTQITGTDSVSSSYTGSATEGDLYLNTSTGLVYKWTSVGSSPVAARWVYVTSLQGTAGARGASIMSGTAVSESGSVLDTASAVGDAYVNTSTGAVYLCTTAGTGSGAQWQRICVSMTDFKSRDIVYVPASSMTPSSTNGSTSGAITMGSGGPVYDTQRFEGGTVSKKAEFTVVLPDSWDEQSVKIKVLWTALSGTAGNNVRFTIDVKGYGDGDSMTSFSSTTSQVTDAVVSLSAMHRTPAATVSIQSGAVAGNALHFRITRDPTYNPGTGGSLSSDVHVLGVVIQYSRGFDYVGW